MKNRCTNFIKPEDVEKVISKKCFIKTSIKKVKTWKENNGISYKIAKGATYGLIFGAGIVVGKKLSSPFDISKMTEL